MEVALFWVWFLGVAHAGVVEGPWSEAGSYLSLASRGSVVAAVWVEGDDLKYAESRSSGREWSRVERIARGVDAGDNGQMRPRVLMGSEIWVAYADDGKPRLMRREAEWRWEATDLRDAEAEGQGSLLDAALVGGKPVVAWLDTRRDPEKGVADVYAWTGDAEQLVYSDGADGVCPCCRPSFLATRDGAQLAFRDADGSKREVRVAELKAGKWSEPQQVTHGGWSPGGCPADGPSWFGARVVVSDGRDGKRKLYRADSALAFEAAGEQLTPRGAGIHLVWVDATPGSLRLKWDEKELARAGGSLYPGEPLRVDGVWWVPYDDPVGSHVIAME